MADSAGTTDRLVSGSEGGRPAATGPVLGMTLTAPSPDAWLAAHLQARFDGWAADGSGGEPHPVVTTEGLLAHDAAVIRQAHRRLVEGGTPAPAAATYLADWFGGIVAGAVGYGLAGAGAGFLVDASPGPRFHVHPGGWASRVELPARACVLADHPWSGLAGVDVAPSLDALLERTVAALVAAVRPLIDTCRSLASVGRVGLWNEIADSLGKAVAFQHVATATPEAVAVLAAATAVPGAPWKARPRLGFATSELLGQVHVAQKGGCCLAYTVPGMDPPDPEDPALDPYHRAYLQRFPEAAGDRRYCSTCSFRDAADCDARQVFWHEHHAPRTADPSG